MWTLGKMIKNHLVAFATVGNLDKFCKAETIYMDEIFKASPQFYQLFTLRAVCYGQHIPLVYTLLLNKTTITYKCFLQSSKKCCLKMAFTLILLSFILTLKEASFVLLDFNFQEHATKVASTISPRQYGKLTKIMGSKQSTPGNNELRFFICQLIALAFLPSVG